MSAARLPAGAMLSGVFDFDAPRRRTVLRLTPRPTVCGVCGTDTERGECPDECPTRESGQRGRL